MLRLVQRDYNKSTLIGTVVAIIQNDSVISDNRINRPCTTYCRSALKGDSFANLNVSRPVKRTGWQRDGITVYCLRVVNGLDVCRRTIGLKDRGIGVPSEKPAPKKSTKNPCGSFHRRARSFPLMRRRYFRFVGGRVG
jgi:hypothetical protein